MIISLFLITFTYAILKTNEIKKYLDEIIRVNHAGEYGAQVIYKSQIKFCKKKIERRIKKFF